MLSRSDTFLQGVAEVLQGQFIPVAETYIAPLGTIPFSLLPFTVLSLNSNNEPADNDIAINYTTDGLNFTVHICNLSSVPVTVVVGMNAAVGTALGVTYTPFTAVVPAYRTTIAVMDAQFTGIDVAAALSDATTKLAAVGAGFDVTAGQTLITQATALLATHPARALAAYVAAARMLYLKVEWSSPNLTVTVRRITLPTEGAGPENVSGARVQVTFPLNGREEQVVEGTTLGSGVATIAVGSAAVERWDVATHDMVAPGATTNDQVEVHVTDSRGMSSRQVKATP